MRALVVLGLVLAVVGASTAAAAPATATARHLPHVLKWVDNSRTITLPNGKTEPRPVTTEFWYPPARLGSGPFPLIVFGHGFASTPYWYRIILGEWAKAGYVVAAPIFPLGNENAPGGPTERDLVNQPGDMSFVITRVLQASAGTTSPLSGLVDPDKVAVAGQSDGAMTAFAAASESPFYDDRIKAALVLSGAILGPRRWAVHTGVPILAVQGTADTTNPQKYAWRLYDAAGKPKFMLLLHGAGHLPPYVHPGPRFRTIVHVSLAFLSHYLGDGPYDAIQRAADELPSAELTSDP